MRVSENLLGFLDETDPVNHPEGCDPAIAPGAFLSLKEWEEIRLSVAKALEPLHDRPRKLAVARDFLIGKLHCDSCGGDVRHPHCFQGGTEELPGQIWPSPRIVTDPGKLRACSEVEDGVFWCLGCGDDFSCLKNRGVETLFLELPWLREKIDSYAANEFVALELCQGCLDKVKPDVERMILPLRGSNWSSALGSLPFAWCGPQVFAEETDNGIRGNVADCQA